MRILQSSRYKQFKKVEEVSLLLLITLFLFTFGVLILHVLNIRPLDDFKSGVFANLTFLQFMALLVWPLLSVSRKTQPSSIQEIHPSERRKISNELRVWSMDDPRVEAGLFHLALPAFVVNAEFKFVDWSSAFSLIFEKELGLIKGDGINKWYASLDNFKIVQERSEQQDDLILAMIDRQRVVFQSQFFGKMVFHHLLSPVIDRKTAKVIGWQVVLNIYSIGQRKLYMELVNNRKNAQINATRYAASIDSIYSKSRSFKMLAKKVIDLGTERQRSGGYFTPLSDVLVVGSEFPQLLRGLAAESSLLVLDDQALFLRQSKYLLAGLQKRVRFVKKPLDHLDDIPQDRFDTVYVCFSHMRVKDIDGFLRGIGSSLKEGGKLIILNWRTDAEFRQATSVVRAELEEGKYYEELKCQMEQWSTYLEERVQRSGLAREAIRSSLLENHFEIVDDCFDFQHIGLDLLIARPY